MWLSNDKILKREISFLPANFLLLLLFYTDYSLLKQNIYI